MAAVHGVTLALRHPTTQDRLHAIQEAAVEDVTNPVLELEQELAEYKSALEKIQQFGHSHGHGRGYTCATWAKETLDKFK